MRGYFGRCTALLGWTPHTFWRAQLWECREALISYYNHQDERRKFEAHRTAWMINSMADAFRSKKFRGVKGTDFYQPQGGGLTGAKIRKMREDFADKFPATKPMPT